MNFSNAQFQSAIRSVLKVGGAATAAAGFLDPALGQAVGTICADVGSLAAAGAVVWSFFAHRKAA